MTNGKDTPSVAPGLLYSVGVRVAVTSSGVFVCVGVSVGVQVGGNSYNGVRVAVGGMYAGTAVRGGKGLNRELGDAKIANDIPGQRQVKIKKKTARILNTIGRSRRLAEESSMEYSLLIKRIS